MSNVKRFRFVGGRIMKTGMAVLITAVICDMLDWPPMFAVITAIVTIEPTAADSIKKAFVRFPASAIGAGYAVLFSYIFKMSPITYAFVTVATIITCYKLRLHAGILVATLTGVAMISTIQDEFVSSFFVRLGTTTTGLIVSSLVNLFVLPPNYSRTISSKIHQLFIKTGNTLEKRGLEILQKQPLHRETKIIFREIQAEIEKVELLCQYQKEEWKFHRTNRFELKKFHYEYKKLNTLRQMLFHVGNLIHLPSKEADFLKDDYAHILTAIQSLKKVIHHPQFKVDDGHYLIMKQLLDEFWSDQSNIPKLPFRSLRHHFTCKTVLKYELLSIHDLVEELSHIQKLEFGQQSMIQKLETD